MFNGKLKQLAQKTRFWGMAIKHETKLMLRSGFSLTSSEQEAVLLICALFILGIIVRAVMWWLNL
jgi:hypothetical protein